MTRLLLIVLALALCGCGAWKFEATPTPAVVQWMTDTAMWQLTASQIINEHGKRLDAIEKAQKEEAK